MAKFEISDTSVELRMIVADFFEVANDGNVYFYTGKTTVDRKLVAVTAMARGIVVKQIEG
jgi:hypothetical protein